MKEGQASRTAQAAAALRAQHFLYTNHPVFSDPYALSLTSSNWARLVQSNLMKRIIHTNAIQRILGLLTAQVVARSRYAEDFLRLAYKQGIHQYVLVGAGLDSFVLRQANDFPLLKIFEVDHPDTQIHKLKKLQELGLSASNVEFVAIDFEKETIADALARSNYQRNLPAFYSWLGTTHYLTPEATLATLESIAKFTAPNSELVMDYSVDYQTLRGVERIGVWAVSRFTRVLSEPLVGQFYPEKLHSRLKYMGYDIVEDLSGKALTARYFKDRADIVRHTDATHMLHLRKSG